ncbi:MAG: aspartate aminotransferase family protein [Chloroflexi bacterium]|nr:aspartate aminotransferase family protein [Chloroflexota bacterium]
MTVQTRAGELATLDIAHLIHPLYHEKAQEGALILERGEGIHLWDVNGNKYIDVLSCLWNVNVGHGRRELAEAAAKQIETMAFCNSYTGFANPPSIELAARLAKLAPGDLNAVFFTSGGAESNESAFKMARFYWNIQGRPSKYKIISRIDGYHGVSTAAMAATGMAVYWDRFGERAPGFVHAISPNPYRLGNSPEETARLALDSIEEIVTREGAENTAAVIAEPIQGAGGVIVPPASYITGLRELCDKHELLLIADEVITGFARTGTMFAMEQFGVQPDIMAFAKGVTSGYVQLGGIVISERIQRVLADQPADVRWMHAYTYSAHPTACAVGLANLDIIERENLPERAARVGAHLLRGLEGLRDLAHVGDVRGFGMLGRIEFVVDPATKEAFPASAKVGDRVVAEMRKRGALTRNRGDVVCFAPPLIITEQQVDELVGITRESIQAVNATL